VTSYLFFVIYGELHHSLFLGQLN